MKPLNIYILQQSLYNSTFPKIILKILENSKKGYILCKNKEEMKQLDNLLWTFSQLSFLPHATEEDDYQEAQSLLLITKCPASNLNDKFLILTSEDLFLEKYILEYTKLFIITTQQVDIQKFIDSIGTKTDEVQIKYFLQNYDASWVQQGEVLSRMEK